MGQTASGEAEAPAPSARDVARQVQRVRLRIRTFRVRAGTEEICAHVLSSWRAERKEIAATWHGLSDPARRALVMNVREKVVHRAKVLHTVVGSRSATSRARGKVVRKLMEKCAFELFDTGLLYEDDELLALVERILENHGGGPDVPFGLSLELDASFEKDVRRFSYSSLARKDSADTSLSLHHDSGSRDGEDGAGSRLPERNASSEEEGTTRSIAANMSANSLQGYYSANAVETARRNGSKLVLKLLDFVPDEAMPLKTRKDLTLELLLEMRDAFLVHFAILVFSELFEGPELVLHKYEYNSDSDTDIGLSETDLGEEDDSSDGSSSQSLAQQQQQQQQKTRP